jgi:hypothetical protein
MSEGDGETDAVAKPSSEAILAQIQARFDDTPRCHSSSKFPGWATTANRILDPLWDPYAATRAFGSFVRK